MSVIDDFLGKKDERLGAARQGFEQKLYWGTITSVDSTKNTMNVDLVTPDKNIAAKNVQINNLFSNMAFGIRIVPTPGSSRVILFKVSAQDWIHVGYANDYLNLLMTDKTENKQDSTTSILQRYLEEGEVQIIGLSSNEIYLSNDGNVVIKSQFGSTLKLDNFLNRFEGNFENCKFEMDHTRLRSGNIIRPVTDITNEEDYIVMKDDGSIVKESSLLDTEEGLNLKEFMVQVGVQLTEEGLDDPDISPTVGYMALADAVVGEDGEPIYSAGKQLKYVVKTADGGGIAIDEDGSVLIMDQQGGTVTKFKSGTDGEKSLRVENTYISIEKSNGIKINQENGSYINLNTDGSIEVQAKGGRGFLINDTGMHVSMPDGAVTIQAKDITFIGNLNLGGGVLRDFLMPAVMTASMFDTHIHAGPSGPPVVPWSPLVLSGALQASKINIAG